MRRVLRIAAVIASLGVLAALGTMVFPIVIVGVLALLAYGAGKASRWSRR